MWPRLTLRDLRIIAHYLGVLVAFSSLTYVVPLVTAVVLQEWEPLARYLAAAGFSLIVGMILQFMYVQPGRLNRQQALVVTGLAWILLAWIASFPLFFSGHYVTYTDALFDGVSGLTTTGATTLVDLDHLSNTDNMFRFIQHLIGGLGLIVVALSLGLFGRGAAGSLYNSEARSEHVVPNVVHTTRFISRVALTFIVIATVVLTVFCLMAGLEPLRALLHGFWLSITGFVTGGFAPTSQSVMYYHSFAMELFLILLMLVGSINFVLHDEIWKGRLQSFFQDIETRTMMIWLIAVTVVMALAMCANGSFNSLGVMLRRGLFMIVSAFTTTGLQNITSNQLTSAFSSGAFLVIALIMAVGGSAGGTSGGMKLYRVGIVAKSMVATIKQTLAPDSARVVVTYYHVGRRTLTTEVSREALTVFLLFVVTYVLGTLIGVAYGYDATQAIFESVAMTSNGGLSSGIVSPGMPFGLEVVYIFQMWAGRLEFVTLLALIVEVFTSLKPHRKAVGQ
ncbi:MAG: potassium transporter TrkG [Coriobacteriia bacterium]|nr:potassium transporter TrkG [Coriobacteriia bacterium]